MTSKDSFHSGLTVLCDQLSDLSREQATGQAHFFLVSDLKTFIPFRLKVTLGYEISFCSDQSLVHLSSHRMTSRPCRPQGGSLLSAPRTGARPCLTISMSRSLTGTDSLLILSRASSLISTGTYLALSLSVEWFDPSVWVRWNSVGAV